MAFHPDKVQGNEEKKKLKNNLKLLEKFLDLLPFNLIILHNTKT